MEFGDLIASNYNSFLVGIVHSLNEGGTSVLRIFDSKDSGYLENCLEINPQRLITDKSQANELSKEEALYDDLEKDYQKIFIEAVALTGVPMHASIINIIKCFLQATGRCKKAILLICPPGKNIEMSFIVLCILSKNSDKQLFLKELSSKASEIFKDEKIHTREVDVFYRAPSSSALGSQTIEAGKQVFLDDSESNPCPVCLERLIDSSNPPSLFTMLCQHTFHASCLLAWGGIRCPLCRRTHTVGHSEEMTSRDSTGPDSLTRRCQVCATSEDIFVCLGCGYEGCGKSKQGHAMVHAADMHHQMGLQVSTNSVYDLNTFCPIYNLTVKPCAEKPHTHSESSSLRDGGKEKHFEEIRMLRAQLVSQSHHFNALLQETDETHQRLLTKLERLNKDPFMKRKAPDLRALRSRIAIQKASNQELEAQIKSLKDSKSYYLERGDALAAQLSKDKAELHQLSSTSLDLERELASRMKLLS